MIRLANSDDIPDILVLERAAATAAHWSVEQYAAALAGQVGGLERLVLVAEAESPGGLNGFLVARRVELEWELENAVVAPQARRRGVGRRLIETLLERAKQRNSAAVFLEVRESNFGARSLYERTGFRQTGRRKSYYTSPAEDAVLYRLDLG